MHTLLLAVGLIVFLASLAYVILVATSAKKAHTALRTNNNATPIFQYVLGSFFMLVGLVIIGFSFKTETMHFIGRMDSDPIFE